MSIAQFCSRTHMKENFAMEVTLPDFSEQDCHDHELDSRIGARTVIRLRTIVADKAGLATAHVTNISNRGCGLQLARPLIHRQYLTLKVYSDEGTAVAQIDLARVTWTEENVAGIEFLSLTQENQARLSRLCNDDQVDSRERTQ